MASFLKSTASLTHATPLPSSASTQTLISLLHGHTYFISCDPHMVSYTLLEPSAKSIDIPAGRELTPNSDSPKSYKVIDKIATLPAGIWSSDVESTYEFVNLEKGVFVRIRSPMGVMMETVWEVREVEGKEGEFELIEDVVINCSKLLVTFVKNTCESGWKGIHEQMLNKLAQISTEDGA